VPKVQLTDRFVSGAKAGDYFDSQTPGLNLRATPAGVRTWFLVYTNPKDRKRARVKLGRYPQTSLARARTLAIEARQYLQEGHDPRERMHAANAASMTVGDLIAVYLAKHARPTLRSAAGIQRRMYRNVAPVIGSLRLADLRRRDITRVLDPVLERGKPSEAIALFKNLRAILRWGVERGDLDACPMEGMKQPALEKPRERLLSDSEIAKLWAALPDALPNPNHQRIVKLCSLTGQRVGEVAGMEAEEIDLKTRIWTIPGTRAKNAHTHTVPLSDAAVAIVREIMPARGKLFTVGDTRAIDKVIARARPAFGLAHWTLHDLRRTTVTGLQQLGVSPIVAGHIINHRSTTKAGVTLSVYSHYDYGREKREALDMWAERLAAIVTGDAFKIIASRCLSASCPQTGLRLPRSSHS
jgi:integrase